MSVTMEQRSATQVFRGLLSDEVEFLARADRFVRAELYPFAQRMDDVRTLETEEAGRGEIHKITAASVMPAAENMNHVLNEAVQIHGGPGYVWESEIIRLYLSIKLLEIGVGTTEVRKIIISGEMLRE